MKRITKTFALIAFAILFSLSSFIVNSAQTKSRKRNVLKKAASVKPVYNSYNTNCLTQKNAPRPEAWRNSKTAEGYLISDCEPMNLTSLYQPKLNYPKAARAIQASGWVSVDGVIDESGKVIWANVTEGHPFLHTEALRAACQTHFKPIIDCLKRRVKTNAILNYNFKIDK